ncbi:hypothetical protein Y045_401 [Burkholderia pseudomallei MSHR2451]|uniref:TraK family protein n=1 Tax=Burkholderia TaxID=32008 RepID=UPI0005378DDC|nr:MULTISPECIES: TraK family protein [Burkholderia]KGW20484.1 hypothetical protein Y045_401 [Burkholderia pseudomallei MSHR2451]
MKTLSERIAARVGTAPASTSHSNRAVVMALREDIQQAISDGWSILAIYRTLHDEGQVVFSYQAFRRHVNRLLLGKAASKTRSTRSLRKQAIESTLSPVQSFTFNAQPNEKDLL